MSKTKIFLGIPSTGTRADAQVYFLEDVKEYYKDLIEFVYPKQCVYRSFHDFARNAMVEEFLESDCDILWFLDSDVVPPRHVLDLVAIHQEKWEAAAAAYPIWMTPPGGSQVCVLFTVYKGLVEDAVNRGYRMSELPRDGIDWLDAAATGCMFLKRSIFAKIEKPYFEFKYNPESRQMSEGEDLGFCLKLSRLGIKLFTDYSMTCKHYKNVCLLDVSNYAMEFSNFKTLEYDTEIRSKIQSAMLSAEEAGYQRGLKDAKVGKSHLPNITKSGLILPSSLTD